MRTLPSIRRCSRVFAVMVAILACGFANRARAGVTFGDTIAQCDTALGPKLPVPNVDYLVCAQTRAYAKDGMSILVGFTEKGLAEEFIYAKSAELGAGAEITEAECETILARYKDDSSWTLNAQSASGPVWRRADNGAFASYLPKGARLVILNNEAMAEHVEKFNVKSE